MAEIKNNYLFAGVLIAVALLAGGVTYQLTPTGNYKICNDGVGWQFNSNTGQYTCGDRAYDCSSVRSTKTGKQNYYCDEATRVELKTKTEVIQPSCPQTTCPKVNVVKYDYDGTKYLCNNEEKDCVVWNDLIGTNWR